MQCRLLGGEFSRGGNKLFLNVFSPVNYLGSLVYVRAPASHILNIWEYFVFFKCSQPLLRCAVCLHCFTQEIQETVIWISQELNIQCCPSVPILAALCSPPTKIKRRVVYMQHVIQSIAYSKPDGQNWPESACLPCLNNFVFCSEQTRYLLHGFTVSMS